MATRTMQIVWRALGAPLPKSLWEDLRRLVLQVMIVVVEVEVDRQSPLFLLYRLHEREQDVLECQHRRLPL